MFEVPYPVLALEHLWLLQIIIQSIKMLAPIVHIQATKGAQVLKLDMALQTCWSSQLLFCNLPTLCTYLQVDIFERSAVCLFYKAFTLQALQMRFINIIL